MNVKTVIDINLTAKLMTTVLMEPCKKAPGSTWMKADQKTKELASIQEMSQTQTAHARIHTWRTWSPVPPPPEKSSKYRVS